MRPSSIRITVPSIGTVGDSIRAIVDVRNPDETTSKYFVGKIGFKSSSGIEMPSEHVVAPGDGGRFAVDGIRLVKKGTYRIGAAFRKGVISGTSNPIQVHEGRRDFDIYWGDIHGHSVISDGIGTPEAYYEYARDVAALDICAITDHDVHPEPITDKEWKRTKDAARDFYDPHRFVTFLAYEWTAGEYFTGGPDSGHHCVYFLDRYDEAKHYLCSDPATDTLEKLWAKYEGWNVITIPHHTAVNDRTFWYGWGARNDAMQPLVEIYSTWGSSELSSKRKNTRPIKRYGGMAPKGSGKTVQEALAQGFRLGFTGGGDGHDGRPGDSNSHIGDPPLFATRSGIHEGNLYSGGLTAVLAGELTREGVWDALKKRRTYATTGARILVDFTVNGRTMGEEVTLSRKDDPVLKLYTAGTGRIRKIDIIRNNREIYSSAPKSSEAKLTFVDRERKGGVFFYYIRVLQEDGNMAWSSPIWIERPDNRLTLVRKKMKEKRRVRKQQRVTRRGEKRSARAGTALGKKRRSS
jgi:hypothetical protein